MGERVPYTIRLQILLAAVILQLVLLGALIGNSLRLIDRAMEGETRGIAGQLAPILDAALAPMLIEDDYGTLRDTLLVMVDHNQNGIVYILVKDATGRVIGYAGKVNPLAPPAVRPGSKFTWKAGVLDVTQTLRLSGMAVGGIQYGIRTTAVAATREAILRQGAFIALFGAGWTIILLGLLAFFLTRRLNRMFSGVREIVAGNYGIRLSTEGRDEIAWVAAHFNRIAASTQSKIEALTESKAYVHAILDNVADGVMTVNEQGTLITANPAAERIFGYRQDDMVGRPAGLLIPDPDPSGRPYARYLEQFVRSGATPIQAEPGELTGRRRDGSAFPLHLAVSGMGMGDSRLFVVLVQDITERKQAEIRLRQSEELFKKAFHGSPEPVVIASLVDGRIVDVNESFLALSGFGREEVLGRTAADLGIWGDPKDRARLARELAERGSMRNLELTMVSKIKEPKILLVSAELLEIEQEPCMLVTGRDITARKQAEEALFEAKERAQVTLHSITDAVITTDAQGCIDYMNPVAERVTGWHLAELEGKPVEQAFLLVNEVTRERLENPLRKALSEGVATKASNYTLLLSRDGRETAVEEASAPIRNSAGQIVGAVLVCHDVSQARQMAHQMTYQATHDSLTGLVNRREFERRLEALISKAGEDRFEHALCYLDLDQFKIINDTCGHVAGDELLRQLTHLLAAKVRDTDTLARLGGDEFGLLLENCPLDQAEVIAEMLRQTVRDFRFVWQEKSFKLGVSIGITPVNTQSGGSSAVLSAADAACYAAKEKGRDRVWVYQPEDRDLARHYGEMQWVSRLHRAFDDDRFRLYCQPIVPLTGPGPAHCEVLLRMLDEKDDLIPPMAFIPAAERYALMPAIDRWVVRTVFSRLKGEGGPPALDVGAFTINLSGMSLGNKEFLDFIRSQLAASRLPAQIICFEITETAAIANLPSAIYFIQELKKLGFRFSLDDFGSGLSSFGYLKNLPVDYLKIDGSFIKDMEHSEISCAMVQAVTNIGHIMGIRTVAEFVENPAILEKVKTLGVDFAQGYAMGKPRPWDEAVRVSSVSTASA